MPAYAEEIEEALLEGVELRTLTQPTEVVTGPNGAAHGLRCESMTLGEFDRSGRRRPRSSGEESFTLPADQVIVAIGQSLDASSIGELARSASMTPASSPSTRRPDRRASRGSSPGGDAASGPGSVVDAIGAGERAAIGINLLLTGRRRLLARGARGRDVLRSRTPIPCPLSARAYDTIPVERRRHNFDEVEQPWCEAVALRQAHRCLRCDYGKQVAKPVEPVSVYRREEIHA